MASGMDPRYEEEIIRMDIDLVIGCGTVGYFTIDLTTNPFMHMGHIRSEIGAALALSLDEITIKNEETVVSDSYIAKIYLKEINGGNHLSLNMNDEMHRNVSIMLHSRIKALKDIKKIDVSIVLDLTAAKDITLTIYKPCFYLYVSKFL